MLSPIRNRFGIPGVISVVALVFAMLGGAYAASNGGGSQTAEASKRKHHKKKKAKAKRGPRGPKGAPGAEGPAGPAGPAGPQGAKGDKGDSGSSGSNGSNGSNGQSVTTEAEPPFGECGEQEGVKLTSASGTDYVCNGTAGAQGAPGEPWTAGGTLPAGETETGTWAYGKTAEVTWVPITFALPLSTALDVDHVHYVDIHGEEKRLNLTLPPETPGFPFEEVVSTSCTGSASTPTAAAGHLCVYEKSLPQTEVPISNGSIIKAGDVLQGASTAGAYMELEPTGAAGRGAGTWAVTAPTP